MSINISSPFLALQFHCVHQIPSHPPVLISTSQPRVKNAKQKTPSHDKMMFLRPRYLRYPTLIIILALFFALRNNVSSFA
jgi:hypothetical protein